jgi:hypothetical protein
MQSNFQAALRSCTTVHRRWQLFTNRTFALYHFREPPASSLPSTSPGLRERSAVGRVIGVGIHSPILLAHAVRARLATRGRRTCGEATSSSSSGVVLASTRSARFRKVESARPSHRCVPSHASSGRRAHHSGRTPSAPSRAEACRGSLLEAGKGM